MGDAITADELTRARRKGEIVILPLQAEGCLEIGNDHDPFQQSGNQAMGRTGGPDDIGGPAEGPVGKRGRLLMRHRQEVTSKNGSAALGRLTQRLQRSLGHVGI